MGSLKIPCKAGLVEGCQWPGNMPPPETELECICLTPIVTMDDHDGRVMMKKTKSVRYKLEFSAGLQQTIQIAILIFQLIVNYYAYSQPIGSQRLLASQCKCNDPGLQRNLVTKVSGGSAGGNPRILEVSTKAQQLLVTSRFPWQNTSHWS